MNKVTQSVFTIKGEKNRQAITFAARRLFEQFGYSKTTIEDIAKSCRISRSSLFYYYDSKEDIFYHSFVSVWEKHLSSLIQQVKLQSLVETRIQNYVVLSAQYYSSVVEQFGTSVSVLLETERQFDNIFEPVVRGNIIGFYEATIEEGVKAGKFPPIDAPKLAIMIGRIERMFRLDAFKLAHAEGHPKVNFQAVAEDTVFVLDRLLSGR